MPDETKPTELDGVELVQNNVYPVSLLSHWSTLPHRPELSALATWDTSTLAGRVLLTQRLTQPSETLWDLCETSPIEFEVDELSAHYGEYESEEKPGEIVTGPIITLYGPSGAVHTGSQPAFRNLQRIAGNLGVPPWHPPIKLRAYRRIGRNRRSYLHVEFLSQGAT